MSSRSAAPKNRRSSRRTFVFALPDGENAGTAQRSSRGQVRTRPAAADAWAARAKLRERTGRRRSARPHGVRNSIGRVCAAQLSEALRQFADAAGGLLSSASKARWCNWRCRSPAKSCTAKRRSIRCCSPASCAWPWRALNDGTQVRLRANPQEIPFWRDYFSRASDISPVSRTAGRRLAGRRLLRAGDRSGQHAHQPGNATQRDRAGLSRSARAAAAGDQGHEVT